MDVFTHGSKEASDARIHEFMEGGYHAMHSLREQGVISAIGAGVNKWEVCETWRGRGDFDLFLLAGRYTLLEQDALTVVPAALRGARHRHRPGRAVQFRHPRHRRPARRDLQLHSRPAGRAGPRARASSRSARAHGVRLIEAALRFPLAHPAVVSVIPGGQTAAEVTGNAEVLRANIPHALWSDLKSQGLLRADAPVPN